MGKVTEYYFSTIVYGCSVVFGVGVILNLILTLVIYHMHRQTVFRVGIGILPFRVCSLHLDQLFKPVGKSPGKVGKQGFADVVIVDLALPCLF